MACGSCKKGKKREANFKLIKRFISMKLLRVKDKKGNVRRVTPAAFNLLKGRYTLLEDQEEQLPEEKLPEHNNEYANSGDPQTIEPVKDDCVSYGELKEVSVSFPTDAQIYTQLTGQKPDGRWSEKKLKEKIEEAKTKVNEV